MLSRWDHHYHVCSIIAWSFVVPNLLHPPTPLPSFSLVYNIFVREYMQQGRGHHFLRVSMPYRPSSKASVCCSGHQWLEDSSCLQAAVEVSYQHLTRYICLNLSVGLPLNHPGTFQRLPLSSQLPSASSGLHAGADRRRISDRPVLRP